jgi:hypothetical protein
VRRIILSIATPTVALCVACGGRGSPSTAGKSGPPPLAQVSTAAAVPSSTRKPGPVIRAACPLLSPAHIASTLGVRPPTAAERPIIKATGGTSYICHYQSGGQYVELFISITPVSGTADQAAALTVRRYTGTLNSVPGVGDAAYYSDSGLSSTGARPQTLVTARAEGRQMRVVTLNTFLGGNPKDKIITLARAVLDRI